MLIEYTARRSLIDGHVAGNLYVIEIGTTDVLKSRQARKTAQRSLSGSTETFYFGADDEWSITFEPVRGARRLALLEFLDSTESGEWFTADLTGAESITQVRRTDAGYTEGSFMPVGAFELDWVQMVIAVRAA